MQTTRVREERLQVGIVEDPRYREHREPEGHPERSERLTAVSEAIDPFRNQLVPIQARPAEPAEILAIHDESHLREIEAAASQAPIQLDADTYVSPASFDIARLAAGGCIDLVRAVARGELSSGLAAVRPPGHHAEADRAMGFCLFNNVAIAARAAQAEGIERVLVFDWDVHHGNGTQHSFESDPNLFYLSTHQFPCYPGTGSFGEVGIGRGEGTTLNIPLPPGCGDTEYVGAVQRLVLPAARAFRPELILVSAGFDAHRDDPLAEMNVSSAGYLAMAAALRAAADDLCEGRLAFILEGGYALRGLREGVEATLTASLAEVPPIARAVEAPKGTVLRQVIDQVAAAHDSTIPDLRGV
ncbi:MAG: histone deacetylase [bacterium]|nr:histone deacetylase [bacterium]MCP5070446.1 histone deacetylase [bacterium]